MKFMHPDEAKERGGRDCLDCKVALLPGYKRCSPCDLRNAVKTGDKAKIARCLKRNPAMLDPCLPGCGEMGACHENMGDLVRVLLGWPSASEGGAQ